MTFCPKGNTFGQRILYKMVFLQESMHKYLSKN